MELAIPSDSIRVLPPGPFPPHGEEPAGTVDLGIRLRDLLYCGSFVRKTARGALAGTVSRLAQAPELLYRSQRAVELLVDTWPLGALVDEAREHWRRGPDPRALGVLERAAELAGVVLGWPTTVDRTWPLPDEQAIRELAGPGPHLIVGRGDRDGAPAVAVALGAPLGPRTPIALPPVLEAHGDELPSRRDALLAAIGRGEGLAVRFATPVPWDATTRGALAAIREAAPAQLAFERCGQAGLVAGGVVPFEDLLGDAPPGSLGDRIARTCSVLVLPQLTPEGRVEAVGVLAWDAPHRPVRVQPGLATVLSQLDAPTTPGALARTVGVSRAELDVALEQLAELGAVVAVS